MLTDSIEAAPEYDIFNLIAGDAGYIPVIRKIKSRNFRVQVLFWNHASIELKKKRNSYPLTGILMKFILNNNYVLPV